MLTREDCIKAARSGGLGEEDAKGFVDALMRDKKEAEALLARGEIANVEHKVAELWGERMEATRMIELNKKRQAAINILKRQELNTFIEQVKSEGYGASDAIEALLVGSNKRFMGARKSVYSQQRSYVNVYFGRMVTEVERIHPRVMEMIHKDKSLNDDIIREMRRAGSTENELAQKVAVIFSDYLEKSRLHANDVGAFIGKTEGYVPQYHDHFKVMGRKADGLSARETWIKAIHEELDIERSFPGLMDDVAEQKAILGEIYANIGIGKYEIAPTGDKAISLPANMANRLGKSRVLHFKDADAFLRYNEVYGRGNIAEIMKHHAHNMSRQISLMETLGPNPQSMLKNIIKEQEAVLGQSLRGVEPTSAQKKELSKLQNAWSGQASITGNVAHWFAELTGESGFALNPSWARAGSTIRGSQILSKLGGASLSALSDPLTVLLSMRVNGATFGEQIVDGLMAYLHRYKGREKEVARELGAFMDDLFNEFGSRFDVRESVPGSMSYLQAKLFKWSGLNLISEQGKAAGAMFISKKLGGSSHLPFKDLHPDLRALLEYHGFDGGRWEVLRHMTESMPDGQRLLVPSRAKDVPDDVLRKFLADDLDGIKGHFKDNAEGFATAERKALDRARRDLQLEVSGMYADEVKYSVLEADAKTMAFMRQGTKGGTGLGEMMRFIMQFKSFPVGMAQRTIGGRRWVRGSLQKGMGEGIGAAITTDPAGLAQAIVQSLALGYLAMSAKDIAKGKMPRDLAKPETWFAAMIQGGGAGIYGDFLFGQVNRFGGGWIDTLAGPAAGEINRVGTVFSQIVRGDMQPAGEDALRIALDNSPFVNLWYTRSALDWLLLYHAREWMSPGTLRRTERRMKKDYGQEFIYPPSQYIRKGGGFK